jgi:hypothetical protein
MDMQATRLSTIESIVLDSAINADSQSQGGPTPVAEEDQVFVDYSDDDAADGRFDAFQNNLECPKLDDLAPLPPPVLPVSEASSLKLVGGDHNEWSHEYCIEIVIAWNNMCTVLDRLNIVGIDNAGLLLAAFEAETNVRRATSPMPTVLTRGLASVASPAEPLIRQAPVCVADVREATPPPPPNAKRSALGQKATPSLQNNSPDLVGTKRAANEADA